MGTRCRSAHSNAYFFGLGKNKRIVLYDTLVEQCSPAQIVAVLAHELGVSKVCPALLLPGGSLTILYVMQHLPLLAATYCIYCSSFTFGLGVQHWKMGHVTRNLLLANAVLLCQFALFGVLQHDDSVLASFGFGKHRPALARFILFTVRTAVLCTRA